MIAAFVPYIYLVSAALFIFGLKGMTRVRSARKGNALGAAGMALAIVGTLLESQILNPTWIIAGLVVGSLIGAVTAVRVEMTSMPEMVALFNGSGGAASAVVALSMIWSGVLETGHTQSVLGELGLSASVTTVLTILIGGVTASGSVVAFLKLKGLMRGEPILLPGRHVLNVVLLLGSFGVGWWATAVATDGGSIALGAWLVCGLALLLGWFLVIPIGGADMPVVVSLLNSYSGIAAAAAGFVIISTGGSSGGSSGNVLVISGALVGASGLILTKIMCVAMNRSLANVLFGGFGAQPESGGGGGKGEYTNVRSFSPEEGALVLESADSVYFVPGYGLAVAQAQHVVKELATALESRGVKVGYAIHPVAGRMPGHMNVLLAEADVPYEHLIEMDQANPEFKNTSVVIVVGANDVVNPAADQKGSPIYGMPVLEVWDAATVIMIKRSLSPGFAGIKNDLFEYDNTMMVFGDAKKVLQEILSEFKEAIAA